MFLDNLMIKGLNNHFGNHSGSGLLTKEPNGSAGFFGIDEFIPVHAHVDVVPKVGIDTSQIEVGEAHFCSF